MGLSGLPVKKLVLITVCILLLYIGLIYRQSDVPVECRTLTPPRGDPKPIRIQDTDAEKYVTPRHHRPTVYIFKEYDLYMHAATLDDRSKTPNIRIFGLHNLTKLPNEFWCRFTKSNGLDIEVQAAIYDVDRSWPDWSPYFAVEMDCKLPKGVKTEEVTLFSRKYPTTFSIPIMKSKESTKRKDLAVCVKPITGELSIPKLVEWFEMFRAVGVEDFITYVTYMSGNSKYVLEYYKDEGILDVVDFPYLSSTLANLEMKKVMTGEERYATYQQVYLVAMHHCFYRYRKMYHHLLFIDVDEVITPPEGMTLQEVIKKASKVYTTAASYLFLTAWHFEEHGETKSANPPPYLYMQRYLMSTHPIDNQPKGVTVVDRAITVNFHTAVDVYKKGYSNELLPPEEYGYLHHFRGLCKDKFPPQRCTDLLKDKTEDKLIPKFRHRVDKQVRKVLEILLLNPEVLK